MSEPMSEPMPLHRPHEIVVGGVVACVCQHCWDLVNAVDDLDYDSVHDVPEPALWPCPTAERTLDLLSTALTSDMIEGVARAAHTLGELDQEPDERRSWDDLEDVDDVLDASAIWLSAIKVYAGAKVLCCEDAHICQETGEVGCVAHLPDCCERDDCPGNQDTDDPPDVP